MADKNVIVKFKNCKFDFERGLIVEHLKDEILEHRIFDVFKDYDVNQNIRFFDLSLKEASEIRPEE